MRPASCRLTSARNGWFSGRPPESRTLWLWVPSRRGAGGRIESRSGRGRNDPARLETLTPARRCSVKCSASMLGAMAYRVPMRDAGRSESLHDGQVFAGCLSVETPGPKVRRPGLSVSERTRIRRDAPKVKRTIECSSAVRVGAGEGLAKSQRTSGEGRSSLVAFPL